MSARVYDVPTDQPEADGTLSWSKTTVVVALVTAGGCTGTGWTYGSGACRTVVEQQLAEVLTGMSALDVPAAHEAMVRSCRNIGRQGIAGYAISAVDIATWDLKARLLGVPLEALLGRSQRGVRIYGSGGFTTYDDTTTRRQLEHWVQDLGVRDVKIKIGESWGTRADRDLQRAALAREVIGEEVGLFVDANGAYHRKQAVRLGRRLHEDLGAVWFEEPVSSDDLDGLREVRDQVSLDVAAGEYGFDETYFARMLAAGAVDCLQIDATRCGGYTTWMRAAAVAAAQCVDVSGHCAPNLHAHLGGAAPNLRHVEYFHDHVRADPLLFENLPEARDGELTVNTALPGHGMDLRVPESDRFRTG